MTYAYLASPYSHPDKAVENERYRITLAATAWLLRRELWVYSPIVHCHQLSRVHRLPSDAQYWQQYNHAMMERAEELIVLKLRGLERSKGVRWEVEQAFGAGSCTLPVCLMFHHGEGFELSSTYQTKLEDIFHAPKG